MTCLAPEIHIKAGVARHKLRLTTLCGLRLLCRRFRSVQPVAQGQIFMPNDCSDIDRRRYHTLILRADDLPRIIGPAKSARFKSFGLATIEFDRLKVKTGFPTARKNN